MQVATARCKATAAMGSVPKDHFKHGTKKDERQSCLFIGLDNGRFACLGVNKDGRVANWTNKDIGLFPWVELRLYDGTGERVGSFKFTRYHVPYADKIVCGGTQQLSTISAPAKIDQITFCLTLAFAKPLPHLWTIIETDLICVQRTTTVNQGKY